MSVDVTEFQSPRVSLLFFYSPICPPCHAQRPIIDDISKRFASRVHTERINAFEDPDDLVNKYSIGAVPTMLVMKDGKLRANIVGLTSASVLEGVIKMALS